MNQDNNTPTPTTEPTQFDTTAPLSQDSKNLALLCWLGSVLLAFIPGLAFYLAKKDDAYLQDQAKEALNWGITFMLMLIVCKVLTLILIGFFLAIAVWLCHIVFCVMGAVAVSDGKPFRVPFALRLIK